MNKVEKVKAEIERLKNVITFSGKLRCFPYAAIFLDEVLGRLLSFIDSLEQPIKRTPADIEAAMQEVEEKSKLFTEAHKDDVASNDTPKVISNDLEEELDKYFSQFKGLEKCYWNWRIDSINIHAQGIYDFAKHFAQWQKERILNNAIEREVKVDAGGYPYIDVTELYDYDKDKPLAKEGDKVKLIIIMEE